MNAISHKMRHGAPRTVSFLIGLISEQITMLLYSTVKRADTERPDE